VRRRAVPDEAELVAAEVSMEVLEELDEGLVVVGPRSHVEHEPGI
jgi:hypothetical protein